MTGAQLTAGRYTTTSEAETLALGEALGSELGRGGVVLLSGQLGAGKTIFVKGLARGLGVDPDEVHSPSFTLVNSYAGATPLYHIDLYRLNTGVAAAYTVDLDEILDRASAVVVIEWAERLGDYPLPADSWRIEIIGDGDEPRRIAVGHPGDVGDPVREPANSVVE